MHGDVNVFDRLAPVYDWIRSDMDPETVDGWLAHADRPIERLVDVGGGPGTGADASAVAERIVVDPAPKMLERAERRGLATERAIAEDLPFDDDSVGAVLLVYSLHHVDDPARALVEAERVLRPGGVVVVREVDMSHLVGRLLFWQHPHDPDETGYQRPDALANTLDEHGFEPTIADRGLRFTVIGLAD